MKMPKSFKIPVLLIAIALFVAQPLRAEQVAVSSSFDKRSVRVGEELHLTIKIEGAAGNIQAPRLPAFRGFDTFYSGRASQINFINGVSSSSVVFSYVLVGRDAGKYRMDPIEIIVGGQRFVTEPYEVEVTAGLNSQPSYAPQPSSYNQQPLPPSNALPPSYGGGSNSGPAPSVSEPPATFAPNDDNIFVRAWTDKTVVYPNEQVLLTYSLYTRFDTRYEGFEKEPEVSGFWIEEIPPEKDVRREDVHFQGKRYVKADIRKIALFPTAPADYTINPGELKATIRQEPENNSIFDEFFNDSFFSNGGFFGRREERLLKPAPIQIKVKPFPEEGKPKSFQGAVGRFKISATIDKETVKQNEPVTLKLVIEGEGNIETLNKPKIPDLKGFKIYDSDSSSQHFKSGDAIGGRRVFEVVFIPTQAGAAKIPAIQFSYFNPLETRYMTLATQEFQLTVTPSDKPFEMPKNLSGDQDLKKDVTMEAKDIRYIQERLSDPVAGKVFSGANALFAISDTLLTLLLVAGILRERQSRLDEKDSVSRRKRNARAQADSRIRRLGKVSKEGGIYFDEIEKILTQYLSDKFNLSAYGVTRYDLENKLQDVFKGEDPLLFEIREFYQLCDESRFAKAHIPEETRQKAMKILRNAMARIEKVTK